MKVVSIVALSLLLGSCGNQERDNNKSIIKASHPSLIQKSVEKIETTKNSVEVKKELTLNISIDKKQRELLKAQLMKELLIQMRATQPISKPIVSKLSSIGKDTSITKMINNIVGF
jgi:hypothetical protein